MIVVSTHSYVCYLLRSKVPAIKERKILDVGSGVSDWFLFFSTHEEIKIFVRVDFPDPAQIEDYRKVKDNLIFSDGRHLPFKDNS